jgi:hypothetical protein
MCPEICEGVHRRATSRARVGISSQVNPTWAAQTFEIGLSVNAGGEAAISLKGRRENRELVHARDRRRHRRLRP